MKESNEPYYSIVQGSMSASGVPGPQIRAAGGASRTHIIPLGWGIQREKRGGGVSDPGFRGCNRDSAQRREKSGIART